MDATCNVQDSIHVFHLVHNMCPGFWVHIILQGLILLVDYLSHRRYEILGSSISSFSDLKKKMRT